MKTVPTDSPRGAIVALLQAEREQWQAEARKFACLADFADHYREIDDENRWAYGQRLVQWGGDGCPLIAEYCSLELAAIRRQSEEAARLDLAHAQAVKFRLPRSWQLVMAGELRVHRAREIAEAAMPLALEDALELDRQVELFHSTLPWRRLLEMVRAFVMEHRDDLAADDRARDLARRGVRFRETDSALIREMEATLDTADAVFLKAQVNRLADILREAGSSDPLEVRRAKALGLLASPARALQLLQASLTDVLPELDPECPAAGQRGHTCGQVTVNPEALLPRAQLVVHLTDESVGTQCGLGRVEGVGPILAHWTRELLDSTRVTVRPVLDPGRLAPTQAYECPAEMREWIALRNPQEVFPHSHRDTRRDGRIRLDLDHTQAWRANAAAPPTRPDNLGPLSRKAHRAKTQGQWQVHQVRPGVFWWESPLGFEYLVTPSHTVLLNDPTRQVRPQDDQGQLRNESPELAA